MIEGNASERGTPTLKDLREAAGLSQEALARQMDVSFGSVAGWERGNSLPRFDKAARLAKVLGVSLKGIAKAIGLDISGIPDDQPQSYLMLFVEEPPIEYSYLGRSVPPVDWQPVLPVDLHLAPPREEGEDS